jgi:nitric oxide reductase subunit C
LTEDLPKKVFFMPGTRLFFFLCLIASTVILAIPLLTASTTQQTSVQVATGLGIWRANGCDGCHTIYGQGGAFAPDLTHIYSQRGETYLREFLVNPGAFHPDQRVMPRFGLTISETDDLLAFLEWVDQSEDDWPPQMIRVSGGAEAITSIIGEVQQPVPESDAVPADPVANGRYWFSRPPANCATCHSLEPDAIIVGPSLAGVATRAQTRVPGQSAEEYLRNSLLHPGDFVVPGFANVMAQNLGDVLSSEQINNIIAFLLTLE